MLLIRDAITVYICSSTNKTLSLSVALRKNWNSERISFIFPSQLFLHIYTRKMESGFYFKVKRRKNCSFDRTMKRIRRILHWFCGNGWLGCFCSAIDRQTTSLQLVNNIEIHMTAWDNRYGSIFLPFRTTSIMSVYSTCRVESHMRYLLGSKKNSPHTQHYYPNIIIFQWGFFPTSNINDPRIYGFIVIILKNI